MTLPVTPMAPPPDCAVTPRVAYTVPPRATPACPLALTLPPASTVPAVASTPVAVSWVSPPEAVLPKRRR